MATFLHLTPEKNLKSILRNGITRLTKRRNGISGVYAAPVTQNFYTSHQWLRELKRRNAGPTVTIYIRSHGGNSGRKYIIAHLVSVQE